MAIEVGPLLGELARGDRRHERVGVDLPCGWCSVTPTSTPRFSNGNTYCTSARPELDVAVGPDLEQQLEVRERQHAERRPGVLREHDDLASAAPRSGVDDRVRRIVCQRRQRREHVLEDRHLPRPLGHLGRVLRITRRGQRVVFRWREERAVLPVRGVGHPLTPQRVPAEVRVRVERRRVRARSVESARAAARGCRAAAVGRPVWRVSGCAWITGIFRRTRQARRVAWRARARWPRRGRSDRAPPRGSGRSAGRSSSRPRPTRRRRGRSRRAG